MDLEQVINIAKDNVWALVGLAIAGGILAFLILFIKKVVTRVIIFSLVIILPALFILKIYFYKDYSLEEIKEEFSDKVKGVTESTKEFGDKVTTFGENQAKIFKGIEDVQEKIGEQKDLLQEDSIFGGGDK